MRRERLNAAIRPGRLRNGAGPALHQRQPTAPGLLTVGAGQLLEASLVAHYQAQRLLVNWWLRQPPRAANPLARRCRRRRRETEVACTWGLQRHTLVRHERQASPLGDGPLRGCEAVTTRWGPILYRGKVFCVHNFRAQREIFLGGS